MAEDDYERGSPVRRDVLSNAYLPGMCNVNPASYDDEHLNAEGHGILADAVWQILAESLERSA